jgi:hypothetical protein
MWFANHPCPKIAIENPVGIMSRIYRKPDQIIQPWQFGDDASKKNLSMVERIAEIRIYKHYYQRQVFKPDSQWAKQIRPVRRKGKIKVKDLSRYCRCNGSTMGIANIKAR